MPVYSHSCEKCQQEFEDIYSMKSDPPTKCLLCGEEGGVRRIMSLTAPGKVTLNGHEFKAKLKEDGRKIAAQARTDEKVAANIIGESNHQENVVRAEAINKNLTQI